MALRVLAILNAHARRVAEARAAVEPALAACGYETTLVESTSCAHLERLIAEHAASVDVIAICGGDGTLVSSVGALLRAKRPLAILPLGTVNELARSLAIPLDLRAACELIGSGEARAIDIGCVNDRYFLNEASFGLSARVARLQHDEALKRRLGMFAVPVTTLRALPWLKPFHVHVREDGGEERRCRTVQVTVANNFRFGALVEDAERHIDDGKLALYVISLKSIVEAVRIVFGVLSHAFPNVPGVKRVIARSFEVRTRHRKRIYADGEFVTCTPAWFSVLPHALPVVVPRAAGSAFVAPEPAGDVGATA